MFNEHDELQAEPKIKSINPAIVLVAAQLFLWLLRGIPVNCS